MSPVTVLCAGACVVGYLTVLACGIATRRLGGASAPGTRVYGNVALVGIVACSFGGVGFLYSADLSHDAHAAWTYGGFSFVLANFAIVDVLTPGSKRFAVYCLIGIVVLLTLLYLELHYGFRPLGN